jgi:hypothetical protein
MRFFYYLLYRLTLVDVQLAQERGDSAAEREFVLRADDLRMKLL